MPEQPTARHRGEGRARRSIDWRPWLAAAVAILFVGVGCAAAVRGVPAAGVALCLSIALAGGFQCGRLTQDEGEQPDYREEWRP